MPRSANVCPRNRVRYTHTAAQDSGRRMGPCLEAIRPARVKDTAGPGEQGLLIGDVVDLTREFQTAVAVSHHNRKNPSAAAESGDAEGEYRDSTAIGAAVDMLVSMSRGRAPHSRRLTPSGCWREDPLTIILEPGVGYEAAAEPEDAEQARSDAAGLTRPLTDRVLLHLLRCDPQARPHARMLAAALDCAGRRYQDLRAALDVLLDAGHVDRAQRPDERHTGSVGTPSPAKDVSARRPSAIVMFPFPLTPGGERKRKRKPIRQCTAGDDDGTTRRRRRWRRTLRRSATGHRSTSNVSIGQTLWTAPGLWTPFGRPRVRWIPCCARAPHRPQGTMFMS